MASAAQAVDPLGSSKGSSKGSSGFESASVDPDEMASFERMAKNWWDPSGPFKPLHIMNQARLEIIKATLCEHFLRDPDLDRPLEGLRLLDIGCGGGLLCEPMSRLGAQVVGVDALETNIKTARVHAAQMGLEIDYRHSTIEHMVAQKERGSSNSFDVVLNMEVMEHVNNPPQFLSDCAQMLSEGGIMMCSTINRTFKAFTLAILGAEYVLGWLPKGTHHYDKFIKPVELNRWLSDAGLRPDPAIGMSYNPLTSHWSQSGDLGVNYIQSAARVSVTES